MWFLLILFIIVKLLVFQKMQNMHIDLYTDKICPKNYNGLAPDPFDCNSYWLCPETIQFFCPSNQQFDLDQHTCVPLQSFEDGCVGRLYRNLLL
ncbi:Chitin-biding protein 1 [Perigonia lusca single nucleopolyhedrovirus]|uniref:Chitin-biding protein 1 n=1 Tax=Perigonia lusca single nucleopolyhedrovirus TaxID=1675865 RepID=A0A0M3WQY9_9ABAC|nr:Chitin-biding protein 1 [Perigonia lusca single nucleopolyhedrovirus]AKN80556.1 Chitin-biding protein 1 [Perigonia lusca single nucleopolyhedrovirus]